MRVVMNVALCLILVAGLFTPPVAFSESIQFMDADCSGMTECAHCTQNNTLHPMHAEAPRPTDSCCPAPPVAPVAMEAECICSHSPGMPFAAAGIIIPAPATTKLVAIQVSSDIWDVDRMDSLPLRNALDPSRGEPLPRSGLFLRTMSIRI